MAFRKRNIGLQRASESGAESISAHYDSVSHASIPGVRPSPLTGQATTSTGTLTLDGLLGGHAGLALGSSLLVEESGTTDFAGALLRFYAAEGITQGHVVHVVGVGEYWVKGLPGLVGAADLTAEPLKPIKGKVDEEKLKIAWRYERLSQVPADRTGRGVSPAPGVHSQPMQSSPSNVEADSMIRTANTETTDANAASSGTAFCHAFDLAKRLEIPPQAAINHIDLSLALSSVISPFDAVIKSLAQQLANSAPTSVHRVIIPTMLSPALYPPHAAHPNNFLRFLHSIRSLLRQYPSRLTTMMTLPLELYHRSSALVRWAELLSDGVVELTPFPHLMDSSNALAESGGARGNEEQPQGMLKVHKLPVSTERGGGGSGGGVGDDLAFTLSRRKFVIKPFSLPPMEGDADAQRGEAESGALKHAAKADIEF